MVKMISCSNSEEQRILKLNESFFFADKIWKAGRSAQQGFGKFKSGKRNPNDGGGGAPASPKSSNEVTTSANESIVLSAQDPGSAPPSREACALRKRAPQIKLR